MREPGEERHKPALDGQWVGAKHSGPAGRRGAGRATRRAVRERRRQKGKARESYCGRGARCVPPSNRGGMTVYTVSVVFVKAKVADPEVPASVDTEAGVVKRQHCRAEALEGVVIRAVAWR